MATALTGFVLDAQNNPVPLVNNPLVPESAVPGSSGFNLMLNGTGFVSNSVVAWNGAPRATVFVGPSQLSATILASDVAAAVTARVTVVNPAPGGGTSNVEFFEVTAPSATVSLATSASVSLSNVKYLSTIIAGDLNGDGKLDLVVGQAGGTGIEVLLGNGDGTFQLLVPISISTYAIAIGDFNDDGKLDLAVAEYANPGVVSVLLGNGDGTFQPSRNSPTDQYPMQIAIGDFNEDGKLDLTVGYDSGNPTSILLGNGDGTFQKPVDYAPNAVSGLLTGDFNLDGHLDVAELNGGGIEIMFGKGDGTFRNPVTLAGSYSAFATADLNGDGILDLASGGSRGISVRLGKGDGTFKAPVIYPGGGTGPLVIGDLNGDGKVDVAELFSPADYNGFSTISMLLGNGDGTFQPVETAPQTPLRVLALGDFYGVGRLDLVSASYTPSPVSSTLILNSPTAASVLPAVLTFPVILDGRTREPETVTVTNNGTAPLNITQVSLSGRNAAEFALATDACQGTVVPVSGTCTVGVSFSPSVPGILTAFLSITDDGVGSPQLAGLAGNATMLYVTPAQVLCGDTPVGTTGPNYVVKITNISGSAVPFSGIGIKGPEKGDFYEYNTCGSSLNPKASCNVVVQFIPTKKGARNAYLSVMQASVSGADPQVIPLSGTGT